MNKAEMCEIIGQAVVATKMAWDKNPGDDRMRACYRLINTVAKVLAEETEDEKDDLLASLVDGIVFLAKYYGLSEKEALAIGGLRF